MYSFPRQNATILRDRDTDRFLFDPIESPLCPFLASARPKRDMLRTSDMFYHFIENLLLPVLHKMKMRRNLKREVLMSDGDGYGEIPFVIRHPFEVITFIYFLLEGLVLVLLPYHHLLDIEGNGCLWN